MVTAELRYECISRSFLIDEYRNTEVFSGYIINFMKHVRFTSPDTMRVDEELHPVQTWKKTFWILWLIDPGQVQNLLHNTYTRAFGDGLRNFGQVTWTTTELEPASLNYHTTPTGGRFSSRQI
ncbi:hypothetical protein TNCV_1603261 [Trichonephila clavipes]|nr:hypothetical protein TNCV_1603261 [Trichonephila clavipes]